MRRWMVAAAPAVVLAAVVGAATAAHRLPEWRWRGPGHPAAAADAPCGGEALSEDTFPAVPTSGAAASGAAGAGTLAAAVAGDQPGATDGRPETWIPDQAAFEAILRRQGATVRMSAYRTAFRHASPSQAANIALVARRLTGQVIPPGAVFSYTEATGPFTRAGGYGMGRMFVGNRIVPTVGGGVCQPASTLFNVVILANLPVVERHFHGLTVPYLAPGRDATVTEAGGLDFRFRNNTGAPLVLWASAQDRWLTIALYGRQRPPDVKIHTEVLERYPFSTETVIDRDLKPGEEVVAAAGQPGVTARAWAVITWPDGRTEQRSLGKHTYRPSPRVILRGPDSPAHGSSPGGSSPSAPPAGTGMQPEAPTPSSSSSAAPAAPASGPWTTGEQVTDGGLSEATQDLVPPPPSPGPTAPPQPAPAAG